MTTILNSGRGGRGFISTTSGESEYNTDYTDTLYNHVMRL